MPKKEPPLHINIADPEDIRANLREVGSRVAAKERQVHEAERELQLWREIYSRLELLAGEAPSSPGPSKRTGGAEQQASLARKEAAAAADAAEPAAEDAVVRILMAENRPLRNREVAEHLPDMNPRTVSWALWNAERSGRIRRIRQGVYGPPWYVGDRPAGSEE